MFQALGQFVSRFWGILILVWLGALVSLLKFAPDIEEVLKGGDFAFLPADSPSLIADAEFERSFPHDLVRSSIVIVVRRPGSDTRKLSDQDRTYIHERIVPALYAMGIRPHEAESEAAEGADADPQTDESESDELSKIVDEFGLTPDQRKELGEFAEKYGLTPEQQAMVENISDWTEPFMGYLLESTDGKASLILIELNTEFIEDRHHAIIKKIQELIQDLATRPISERGELGWGKLAGLDIQLSGSATVGRDMRIAARESAKRTEMFTVVLVLVLLILIYRAPLLAIIPLITVAVSVAISMHTLSILAHAGWVSLFKDIQTYVTVIIYGAGVDYCLFLIARYKEELDRSGSYNEAIADSLEKVGHAVAASAGTVICGIGLMAFAEFGKFQQAGIGIAISLVICLAASLTFAPALMRLTGKWAFWPHVRNESITRVAWLSSARLMGRLMNSNLMNRGWAWITERVRAHPGRMLCVTLLIMLPFAVVGVTQVDRLSYGLLQDLPSNYTSVVGARAVQDHFSPGTTAPIRVLLENPSIDFSISDTKDLIHKLTGEIEAEKERLHVADIRSVNEPTGITPIARQKEAEEQKRISELSPAARLSTIRVRNDRINSIYISQAEGLKDHVMRLDIVFSNDPFTRDSIANFTKFRNEFKKLVKDFDRELIEQRQAEIDELKQSGEEFTEEDLPPPIAPTQVFIQGATAGIVDLKHVTDRDQIRIDIMVLAGVYLILVVLLRQVAISAYLLLTVFFSYFATLGIAISVCYLLDPSGFAGLDWKVPIFLFTILIAVGEDYNIFLMTRINEEQKEHGLVDGTLIALRKTGSIISSCGIIMAGTFSSLVAGTLTAMQQLGFALALGVLLDTFVVRPILVPAWLVLLYRGRFGKLGKFLGAPAETASDSAAEKSDSTV